MKNFLHNGRQALLVTIVLLLICGLYTLFLVAELFLMFKFARLGPSSLKTGRYHYEQSTATTQPAR